ncbi:hypothetical protein ACFE04_022495 [Oxalis oulophora]
MSIISFKYWDECVDPMDMEAMWGDSGVRSEWLDAGETIGQKVHLSRDPDGLAYLTQTEMKAVVDIIVRRHFDLQIDPDMICCIAELESDRRPLITRCDKKTKETTIGIMQLLPRTAEWLISGGYGAGIYDVAGNPDILYRPFVNVYFGAAYLKCLSSFDRQDRSEEFVVRSYKGGTKKATHKSTLPYWKRYLAVKETLPSRKHSDDGPSKNNATSPPPTDSAVASSMFWDTRASPEDMEAMWSRPEVAKEWNKTGEKRGQVRFSKDKKRKPYLSRIELKAVADIILSKYFSTRGAKPSVLCALAEIVSMRFVNGVTDRPGIMGIDYRTAFWLYAELGYRAYRVDSNDDLVRPFVSMYFGASYLAWLFVYEGRERTPQFVVQAYLAGPKNVNQETCPVWLKFEQALGYYEDGKKDQPACTIL